MQTVGLEVPPPICENNLSLRFSSISPSYTVYNYLGLALRTRVALQPVPSFLPSLPPKYLLEKSKQVPLGRDYEIGFQIRPKSTSETCTYMLFAGNSKERELK